MSVLKSHNNKMRGGLGRVCATGMYRSIEQVKFPKFQTGITVEWKAPNLNRPQTGLPCDRACNSSITADHFYSVSANKPIEL